MDRKAKIEYIRKLASGQMAPSDILQLLPKKTMVLFEHETGPLNDDQLNEYAEGRHIKQIVLFEDSHLDR